MDRDRDIARIEEALQIAAQAVRPFTPGRVEFTEKDPGDPVTAADHAINDALLEVLPAPGEGWLSEETVDDRTRLTANRVWVVDPLDGTREFVQGIPEWSVSIGLVEDGVAVAGGVLNPATGQMVLGSLETGVTLNGQPAGLTERPGLDGAVVLASRSEMKRGEWQPFETAPFEIRPCGSVAYKMSMVAAGVVDATWTLVPKNEWDVAAGVALVRAAGGVAVHEDGTERQFNQADPLLPNLLASKAAIIDEFRGTWLTVVGR